MHSNAHEGTKLAICGPFAAPLPREINRGRGDGRTGGGMYQQVYDPVSNSLGASSIFAALPLITQT